MSNDFTSDANQLLLGHKPPQTSVNSQQGPPAAAGSDGRGRVRTKRSRDGTSFNTVLIAVSFIAVLLFVGHLYDSSTSIHHQTLRFINRFSMGDGSEDADSGPRVYAIMMDAGSTGSRVLVFTFERAKNGNLVLLDEFFKEVKPGISSYSEHPELAAKSIQGLIDDAKDIIPSEQWSMTPISLKATAGLRLLPANSADNLLNTIREVFSSSGFSVQPNAVSIIDGTSEGLYLWTTINFLLGKTTDVNETVVVADLGGGSAQLAMVPLDPRTLESVPKEDVTSIAFLGQTAKFYIHSYLGLGLMAMRLAILKSTNETINAQRNDFHSLYMSKGAKFVWEFQGKVYDIQGLTKAKQPSKSDSIYKKLRREVSKLIKDQGVIQVNELKQRTLFAVSYFYDRAVDGKLIASSKGGSVFVKDFCAAAKTACENLGSDLPFECIDNTYLCSLLEDGFGLQNNQIVNLKKKIDGHETSWALGAALSDLEHQRLK